MMVTSSEMLRTLSSGQGSEARRAEARRAETRELLDEIAAARDWMCRWQRQLTLLHDAAVFGKPMPDAVAVARSGMGEAHECLARLREELKRHDPHAWRVHEYGLALATEGARAVQIGHAAQRMGAEGLYPAGLRAEGDCFAECVEEGRDAA